MRELKYQKIITYPELVRGAAILLNPDQSGLKIYTLNHSLLGTVPGSDCRPVLWGLTSLTPGIPEEDAAPSLVNHYHSPATRWQEAQARALHPGTPPLAFRSALHTAYTNLLQPLSTSRLPSSLPAQVQGPWGAQTLAWQVSRPGAGQEKAGPESCSTEYRNLQKREPSFIVAAHHSRVLPLERVPKWEHLWLVTFLKLGKSLGQADCLCWNPG